MVKKYYFINKFETNNIDGLDKQTTVIYRNYNAKASDEEVILKIKKYCKKKGIKFYLSNNIQLAIKLNLDGAYLPSFNKSTKHLAFSYKRNFDIVGSAHNLKEIKTKEKQKVNKIFLSSLLVGHRGIFDLNISKIKTLTFLSKVKIKSLNMFAILIECDFSL